MNSQLQAQTATPGAHPRTIGWFGTTAVAMGGINLSLFMLGALLVGQGAIPGQGTAAIPLLIVGLLLGWAAVPGWTELILMYPNRVGGIAATCAEAFRPYSPVLANLAGVCYWWGWVPVAGVSAVLAGSAIHQWFLPWCPVSVLGTGLVLFFTLVSLCGVKWVMRLAMPIATASAVIAFLSALIPIVTGNVDWQQAFDFKLTVPFPGWFGGLTSVMAGLYLIGFAAPAFEQAASHVGETINPNKNVPRAMFASAALATLYFVILPVVWLGTLGPEAMAKDLAQELGPTFAPLLGAAAKSAAMFFMIVNMFHGIIAPLAGASRTLSQLAEDGLLPELLAKRSRTDVPWVATLLTAGLSLTFLFIGDSMWLVAAANFTYLIGISLASVAVWLLRRDAPDMPRPYRAPRGTIVLGLVAAGAWMLTTVLGFQQFGLRTVLAGILFAYAGTALYAWRKAADRRKLGLPFVGRSLHVKLTGAMLLVLALDAAGYLIAVGHVPKGETALTAILADIFVLVALLTIGVGLILPGMIAHAAVEVSKAADHLVQGTLADFTRAMRALAAGDLNAAKAQFNITPVVVHSRDEVGDMAESFNKLQEEIGRAASELEGARKGLMEARDHLELRVEERTADLSKANCALTTAHQEVKAGEHRLRVILETQPECVKQVAADGTLLSMNRAGLRLIEADTLEQVAGRCVYDLVAPEHQAMFRELNEAVFRGEARTAEFEIIGLKGTRRWMETHACPLRDLEGAIIAHLAVTSDITARKRTEQETLASLKEVSDLRAALDAAAIVSVTDQRGIITSINDQFCAISKYSREELVGQDHRIVNSGHHSKEFIRELWTSVAQGRVWKGEMCNRAKDGTLYWVDTTIVPFLNAEGKPVQYVAIRADISERKLAEKELSQAQKELLASSRQAGMAEIATGVLHNVGNVLNSVNVSANLLSDQVRKTPVADLGRVVALLREQGANLGAFFASDPRGPKVTNFLAELAATFTRQQESQLGEVAALQKNIEHIKEIVAMQQSYAKVSGLTENLSPVELIEDALRMNAGSFQKHEVELVRELPADLPRVCVDKHKVLQILVNLLRNAKHACDDTGRTDKRITVRAVNENERIRITISDNGVGIPPENLNRIFNHGFTTKKEGHGFGLHSAANAAKEMGGGLSVHSDGPGGGATFTLELPAETTRTAVAKQSLSHAA